MHKLESVLKNETHKILWDLEIQTDHQILTRRPDQKIISGLLSEIQRKGKELGPC